MAPAMIRSMSGYGRGGAEGDTVRVSFEVRSVNHRFCRVSLHLPGELAFLESEVRQVVRERVERGKVDVSATVTGPGGAPSVQVDRDLAESYRNELRDLADELGLFGDLDLVTLAGLPGVLAAQTSPQLDPERDEPVVREALEAALDALDEMRQAEGRHLGEDVEERLARIDELADAITEVAAEVPKRYRDQLHERIQSLCEDMEGEVDQGRLAQEVAHYADRADINEELVRVRSHVAKARELLATDGAVGRSLEFLLQELHREINTIGAKAKAVEVGETVVELKSELERIREQAQNIE